MPSPFALAAEEAGTSPHAAATEFPGAHSDVKSPSVDDRLTNQTADFAQEVSREATFVEVAAQDLAAQIQQDSRSIALIQRELLDRCRVSRSHAGRWHILPNPALADEVARMLGWCRRLAQNGQRPVLVVTDTYVKNLIGQFREKLCVASLPVRFIVIPEVGSGETRDVFHANGRAHAVLAFLRLLPDTVIMAPKDGWELRQMLRLAADHDGPIALQIPRGRLPAVHFPDFVEEIDFGKAEILEDGDDVALLTLGALAAPAVEAAVTLSQQGLSVGVVNARFVQPLDAECLIRIARRVRGIVTVEDNAANGGFGSAVLELLASRGLTTPVVVTGAAGDAGDTDSAKTIAQIIRSATALVEHRGHPDFPAWDHEPRQLAAGHT
ncbi:MAG: transketolase C-terminal domain-containing protein, partial [Deltaproteobacteria bacterium]